MENRERGFTLVELMITVGIIAILASLAASAYQDYVARAQAAEGMSLASGAKIAIASYYGDHGLFPTDNEIAGMAAPDSIRGRYVSSVSVGNGDGVISVAFGSSASAKLHGQHLTLQVTDNSGSLRWTCGGLDRKHLPSNCN